MSEKTKAQELKELLFNKKENGVDFMSDEELKACDEFCEGYKKFLFENKTEREFANSAFPLLDLLLDQTNRHVWLNIEMMLPAADSLYLDTHSSL